MQRSHQTASTRRFGRFAALALASLAITGIFAQPAAADDDVKFDMVRSAALNAVPACVPNAAAHVTIEPGESAEHMVVKVEGLPPNTDFDFFVLQIPHAPFGMAWYQGDIETNGAGKGRAEFVGRFNFESFIVAPGSAPAPVVFNGPFPDASSNPATAPIQTYHLGLWFNSPQDAVKAGCPATVTPFNGEHDAGIQVLNTSNFADLKGPLLQVH
jgi:hypothetical protein